MSQKESEIVDEDFVAREDTYNMVTGGVVVIQMSFSTQVRF